MLHTFLSRRPGTLQWRGHHADNLIVIHRISERQFPRLLRHNHIAYKWFICGLTDTRGISLITDWCKKIHLLTTMCMTSNSYNDKSVRTKKPRLSVPTWISARDWCQIYHNDTCNTVHRKTWIVTRIKQCVVVEGLRAGTVSQYMWTLVFLMVLGLALSCSPCI